MQPTLPVQKWWPLSSPCPSLPSWLRWQTWSGQRNVSWHSSSYERYWLQNLSPASLDLLRDRGIHLYSVCVHVRVCDLLRQGNTLHLYSACVRACVCVCAYTCVSVRVCVCSYPVVSIGRRPHLISSCPHAYQSCYLVTPSLLPNWGKL